MIKKRSDIPTLGITGQSINTNILHDFGSKYTIYIHFLKRKQNKGTFPTL
ncbi:hypothetical protein ACUN24_20995 [Pedobacter sp. WC2501]